MDFDRKKEVDTEVLSYEQDYQPTFAVPESTRFLPGTQIEIVREGIRIENPEHVLFDFDGTLSLIREGWISVMTTMMVEVLLATGTDESSEQLETLVRDFILRLNGKQTIYQMFQLAEEIRIRGGSPLDPLEYKSEYHDRLMKRIGDRREALRDGRVAPESFLVPNSMQLLGALRERGVSLYLASGTDEKYVREEAHLLGLGEFFRERVYGAVDEYLTFSKAMVIGRILQENQVPGSRLIGFGDGYVEIQNISSVGGVAIAVASDEENRSGIPNPWKRERLIGVGADIVIPDFQDHSVLLDLLWDK
jgi:phosphoglycolate phosphatase-like HAD superfamily hydrolase